MNASPNASKPASAEPASSAPALATASAAATAAGAIHPLVQPLADVLGTWTGQGHGQYSSQGFDYNETVSLSTRPGKTFIVMENASTTPDGKPMHLELGFLRIVSEPEKKVSEDASAKAADSADSAEDVETIKVELIMAQATGQAEILYGTVTRTNSDTKHELRLEVTSDTVHNTETAKTVNETKRQMIFDLDKKTLTHMFGMAAVGKPMQDHLESHLTKTD